MSRMHHSDHVKMSNFNIAYHKAQQVLLQLKEDIKDHSKLKGLKLLNKLDITKNNLGHADAIIEWKNGPNDWAFKLEERIAYTENVSVIAQDSSTLLFFEN